MASSSEEEMEKLEDYFSDVDVLNVSFSEMEIDVANLPSRESTPVKEKFLPKKHPLTPSAKEIEPSSKRLDTRSDYVTLPSTSFTNVETSHSKVSGFQIKKRRNSLASLIRENYEISIGEKVTQSDMLQTLDLKPIDGSRLSKAISKEFPDVQCLRIGTGTTRQRVYCNIQKKCFISSDGEKPKIVFAENSAVDNIKKAIERLHNEQTCIHTEMTEEMEKEELDSDYMQVLLDRQKKINNDLSKYTDGLIGVYEKEIQKLIDQKQVCQLSQTLKDDISHEVEMFKTMLNLGLTTKTEIEIDGSLFSTLSSKLSEDCPLLFEIVESLLLVSSDGSKKTGRRIHSASHALAILFSLRSQKITNDFKILFTLLCISHGAGMRFVGMLNHIGLTVSWKKAMQVLDDRMIKAKENIKKLTPTDIAIILLMDNINIYKGKRKHLRIFKEFTPSMWNFTGRAVIIPFLSDEVKKQIRNKDDSCKSQKDVLKINASDILYNEKNEDDAIFEKYIDYYLLSAMDKAYNCLANSKKNLSEMNEQEFDKWLSTSDFSKTKRKYKIKVPSVEEMLDTSNSVRKTDVFVLPLSLEDNATIAGTSAILTEFEKEFCLRSTEKNPQFLPYDTLNGQFDLSQARSRFEYMMSHAKHLDDMANFEQTLLSREMHLDGVTLNDILDSNEQMNELDEIDNLDGETGNIVNDPLSSNFNCTLEGERRRFRNEDDKFWQAYNGIASRVLTTTTLNNDGQYLEMIRLMSAENLQSHKDHLKRSFLHIAVEKGNNQLAKALIFSGFNINMKEGCGLTPLHLAMICGNNDMVCFLLDRNAKFDGPMFSGVPSPKTVAEKLHLTNILDIINDKEEQSDEENDLITCIDSTFRQQPSQQTHSDEKVVKRDTPGFVTHVVGDVGTCKTNSAVLARSNSFDWAGICVGDMHNKGYLSEACFKEHGQSGLHYIVHDLLKRKKLTTEAFKSRKFQENFLTQIREANRDVCFGYCIAACLEFRKSKHFPKNADLANSMKSNGNHSYVLLQHFKKWLKESSMNDVAFKHHSSTFLYYGPLMQMYDECIRYGDGKTREVVYKLLVPVYAQLGFRNYFQETFRHLVNFIAKWPRASRSVLQNNCCVNLLGNKGKGIEMDAYVESEVVCPLKTYFSGHTTVKMCQRIMGSVDLLKSCRSAYKSKESFDVHHTSRHSEQTPFPDQLKTGWFCLTKGFFLSKGRKNVEALPVGKKGAFQDNITSKVVSSYYKGEEIIKRDFKTKLYECFPDLRYNILVDIE